MPSDTPVPLRPGLPGVFDGENGYQLLCSLLGITTTKHKFFIVRFPAVKRHLAKSANVPRHGRQAKRLRAGLLALYGDPDARREIWKWHQAHQPDKSTGHTVPSLERAALEAYDGDLLTARPEPNALGDCEALFSPDIVGDDWRAPALAALPRIKNELEGWGAVAPDHRPHVALAAFAVATLLDDARLLHWAAEINPDLAQEFGCIDVAVANEKVGTSDHDSSTDKLSDDTLVQLRERASALANAVRDLVDQPVTAALFDALEARATDLLQLRAPTLALVNAANAINDLHTELAGMLNEKAGDAPWLGADLKQILVKWREAYPATSSDAEVLRGDIARIAKVIPPALAEVEAADARALTARKELQADIEASGAPSLESRERQAALRQSETEAEKQVVRAMKKALGALDPAPNRPKEPDDPPDGDPSPNVGGYGREGGKRDAAPITAPMAEAPQPDPPPDRRPPRGGKPHADKEPKERTTHKPGGRPTKPPPATTDAPNSNQEALWRAVGKGRIGIAYHIAKLARATGGSDVHPTPELLQAVALGMAVGGPEGDLANVFAQRVGPLSGLDFEACAAPLRDALNLLLLCASLRPALFSSQHGASIRLLKRVEFSTGEFAPLRNLTYSVAACAEELQGDRLDVDSLAAILDEGLSGDRMDEHRSRVAGWRKRAASATFIGSAHGVWQYWLSAQGTLGSLSQLLTDGTANDVPSVRETLATLSDPKAVRNLVDDTHQRLGRHGARIVGGALAQLQRHLQEPCDLANHWLRIVDLARGGGHQLEGKVERLRDRVNSLCPPALDAVRLRQASDPGDPLASALVCAEAAIADVGSLFQSAAEMDGQLSPKTVRQALLDDLLFVTAIPIDRAGDIDSSVPPVDALAYLTRTAAHAVDLPNAFQVRLDEGDLQGAHAVCERMETDDHAATDDARVRLKKEIGERRASLQRRVFELVGWLEQSFIAREMDEGKRAELTARIDDVSRRLDEDAGVLAAGKSVEDIAAEIEPSIASAEGKVRSELRQFTPLKDAREQALIDEAFDARDVATLREQLGWLRADQPIRTSDSRDFKHLPAFLDAVAQMETDSDSQTGPVPDEILRAVRSRQDILGLAFSRLAQDQSERSATLLERWFDMVWAPSVDQESLAGFFTALGFNLRSTGVQRLGDAKALLQVEPLRVPAICPDHHFGSDADGRYDVLVNSSTTDTHESIIHAVDSSQGHTVVVHLGKLTRNDREGLRGWSIEQARPFITIDENLILYLAAVSEGTLRPLFDCTLPFTCTRPYFTAAGLVPPEAFFGREGERAKIRDRYGSCFVYGGRQLGKTALLHHVRATFHSPDQGQLAEYVDLRARDVGIGEKRPDHLWHVLWGVLKQLGVVDDQARIPRGRDRLADKVEEEVERWLGESQDRRLLVLLDEADAFLEADLKDDDPFRVSTRLKKLMDSTERRFKAILCGLHNVLRNTESANHPLAHFGDPVCVGPLLENGDLRRARELVRRPMAAVGYTFQSENLVTKILLWTNYYPSLIQVFCEALLDHLRQLPGRPLLDPITYEEIRRVFGRFDLQDRIRGLFSLTLGLDQRYEVVAYSIAYELLHSDHNLADGLPRNLIFDRVREYWKVGFDIRAREFDTLLLEMCGLGVLRQRTDGTGLSRFAFRNLNVLPLLGDEHTIVKTLTKERELPVPFDAPTWHARHPGAKLESRRGPLTYQQESVLNKGGRVAVISGTAAANVDSLVAFLELRMEDGRVLPLEPTTDGNALAAQVMGLRPDRPDRATVLRVVDELSPWSLRWIEGVAEALHRAQRGRLTRVVFRADPDKLWDFVAHLPEEGLDASPGWLFDWVVVGPWDEAFVKQWCIDHALHEALSKTHELFHLTGGWPLMLERYAECPKTSWQDRTDALNRYIIDYRDEVLGQLGLGASQTRRALAPLLAWSKGDDGDSPDPLHAKEVDTYAEWWAEHGRLVDADILQRRMFWAVQLGLIEYDNGSGIFNPLVARLLSDDGG